MKTKFKNLKKSQKIVAIAAPILILLALFSCGSDSSETPDISTSAIETAFWEENQTSESIYQQIFETTAESETTEAQKTDAQAATAPALSNSDIPAYSGEPYAAVNGNKPSFPKSDIPASSFEIYSELDSLGRCGTAFACLGRDLMPTGERGSIGQIKPSGWQTVKYDFVDGKYLYNRCHLIGWQLSGENANEKNLITGTRYMNVQGMLPFENMVADYIKETNNHVMYRVTPIFKGSNLVASGVMMEAYSVEDNGKGICFCVYCYNVQPGVKINYATGESSLEATPATERKTTQKADPTTKKITTTKKAAQNNSADATYIININTGKFHYPNCSSVGQMKESNKRTFHGSRDELVDQGYSPCQRCNP